MIKSVAIYLLLLTLGLILTGKSMALEPIKYPRFKEIVSLRSQTKFAILFSAMFFQNFNVGLNSHFIESLRSQPKHSYVLLGHPSAAMARNLPEDTGSSGKFVGTSKALLPILNVNQIVIEVSNLLEDACKSNQDKDCQRALLRVKQSLTLIPSDEKSFKRLFDEFSGGVTYRQQYLDKNAFLVYYTQGFDGPNRPSIETDVDGSAARLAEMYGYRNEAWIALDDISSELEFALAKPSDTADVRNDLKHLRSALDSYLALAPADKIAAARKVSTP